MAVIAQGKERLRTISTETPSLHAFRTEMEGSGQSPLEKERPSPGFAETDEAKDHHGLYGGVIETSVITGPSRSVCGWFGLSEAAVVVIKSTRRPIGWPYWP
jgi:hypothetical protein